jgi:hypothetical protein
MVLRPDASRLSGRLYALWNRLNADHAGIGRSQVSVPLEQLHEAIEAHLRAGRSGL